MLDHPVRLSNFEGQESLTLDQFLDVLKQDLEELSYSKGFKDGLTEGNANIHNLGD